MKISKGTIDIYTTPTCGFCKALKAFLTEKKISYAEHDVTTDEKALEEMQALSGGGMQVPFYKCQSCQKLIKAKSGDCCVFCSYGDQHCPLKS